MKALKLGMLSVVTLLTISSVAQAQHRGGLRGDSDVERVSIEYYDAHFGGRRGSLDNTLYLKQKLMQQRPELMRMIRNGRAELLRVRLVAKSKHGQGSATLMVGQREQDRSSLYGNPRDFRENRPMSYDSVILRNYNGSSQGKWQIKLDGNIKVKRAILVIKKEQRHYRDDDRRRRRRDGRNLVGHIVGEIIEDIIDDL